MKNKFMKTILITMLTLVLMVGCNKQVETDKLENNNDKTKIITSFYPMYILTTNIAKDIDSVEVMNLTQSTTGCLHDYSLTTNNMKSLDNGDIFVINGADMESFMDKVIKQMPKLKIIEASENIDLIQANAEEHEHEEEHEHSEVNPHVWLSIPNAIKEVENIANKLGEYDPANKEKYNENAKLYIKKLEEQNKKMHEELKSVEGENIITFHEAFPYFAEEFKLNIVGVVEREPGSQPSAKELQDTIEKIKKLNVKAIFVEPQYSQKVAETISKETGVKVYTLDPIVTGEDDLDAYTSIMDKNLETLKEALK